MNVLKEIEFALQHGHTDIKVGVENDGTPYVMGTFGYVATSDKVEYQAIMELINKYTVVETESKVEKLHTASQVEFTEKELKVITAIGECSLEYGLPISVNEIQFETKLSKRSIVGVISSLYKKGIAESYNVDGDTDEFHFTEEAFNKYVK